jgi:hypothetical protein
VDRPSSTLVGWRIRLKPPFLPTMPTIVPAKPNFFDMWQRPWLKPPLPKCFDCLSVQNTLTGRSRDHNLFHAPSFYVHTQHKYPLRVTVREVTKESPMTPVEDVVLSERRILRKRRVCHLVRGLPARRGASERTNAFGYGDRQGQKSWFPSKLSDMVNHVAMQSTKNRGSGTFPFVNSWSRQPCNGKR